MFDLQGLNAAAAEAVSSIEDTAEAQATMVALRAVGQYLIEAGLTLGQDFSFAQNGLVLNKTAFAHLQQKLGPKHFEEIMQIAPGLIQLGN